VAIRYINISHSVLQPGICRKIMQQSDTYMHIGYLYLLINLFIYFILHINKASSTEQSNANRRP